MDVSELKAKVAVLGNSTEGMQKDLELVEKTLDSVKIDVQQLKFDVDEFKTDFEEHKNAAFPNGDVAGHKSFHEDELRKQKSTADIKKEVVSHILMGIFWAAAVAIFWSCVYAVKEWMKK